MRGKDEVRGSLFSDVDLELRIRPDHPLRMIRAFVNVVLTDMSAELDALYPLTGRDSIPPERLLRALPPLAFFWIRSERQLVERIDFDLLFRWFVGLGVDDPVWDATTFTKNHDRLLAGEVASRFLATVLAQPKVGALLSTEHFSVDGTLLQAWASTKSFQPKDSSGPPPGAGRDGEQDFRGQKCSNDTRASTTDPDARLYRKGPGKEAKLCFIRNESGMSPATRMVTPRRRRARPGARGRPDHAPAHEAHRRRSCRRRHRPDGHRATHPAAPRPAPPARGPGRRDRHR
jgi:transposase